LAYKNFYYFPGQQYELSQQGVGIKLLFRQIKNADLKITE